MEKEDLIVKRFQDLAAAAQKRDCVTYSDFLNLNEQSIFHQTLNKFPGIRGETFGGYPDAERRVAAFIPDTPQWDGTNADDCCTVSPSGIVYPIHCIHIRPRSLKFAETFSHRDVLGALMHLGIDRATTGDIAVTDREAWLFCSSRFSELICQELTQVRHTQITCSVSKMEQFSHTPSTQLVRGSVASIRLDAVIALAFGESRNSLLSLIEHGGVFVNGKVITSNACVLKEGDIVSVHGKGRFRYKGTGGQSRKGRIYAELERFV
ncbi:MAG: YlmH/Sll1252 family protein [Lachnospiraceae bacterium]|nr:YlmH/Sll1252 family protein [Lachnospiraceae bacterium]